MAITFPSSPTIGDTHQVGENIYEWDGVAWEGKTRLTASIPGIIESIKTDRSITFQLKNQDSGEALIPYEINLLDELGQNVILNGAATSSDIKIISLIPNTTYTIYAKALSLTKGPSIEASYTFTTAPVGVSDYSVGPTTLSILYANTSETVFTNEQFGDGSVDISDDYIVIGGTGFVQVYNAISNEYILTLDNPGVGTLFGKSCATSGKWVIVGDTSLNTNSGVAYVYDMTSITPTVPVYTINNPNEYGLAANDFFGRTTAIYGNHLIVGASSEADGSIIGVVYYFDLGGGTPTVPVNSLLNPNAELSSGSDSFGADKIDIYEQKILVGARTEDYLGTGSGIVYLFDGVIGNILHTFHNENNYGTTAGDAFGSPVSINENYICISAISEDEAGATSSGVVYIYDTTTYTLLYTLTNPNIYGTAQTDVFGGAVACWGDWVAASAYLEDNAISGNSGVVYLFDLSSGTPTVPVNTLSNPNTYGTEDSDYFGIDLAIGRYGLAVVAREDSADWNDEGKVYIYN